MFLFVAILTLLLRSFSAGAVIYDSSGKIINIPILKLYLRKVFAYVNIHLHVMFENSVNFFNNKLLYIIDNKLDRMKYSTILPYLSP